MRKEKCWKRHGCSLQGKSADNLREGSPADKPPTNPISFVQSQKERDQKWQKGLWASCSSSAMRNWETSPWGSGDRWKGWVRGDEKKAGLYGIQSRFRGRNLSGLVGQGNDGSQWSHGTKGIRSVRKGQRKVAREAGGVCEKESEPCPDLQGGGSSEWLPAK